MLRAVAREIFRASCYSDSLRNIVLYFFLLFIAVNSYFFFL